jgi:hypothetical protein
MNLPRGIKIPWKNGVPDFTAHIVPGPNNMHGSFNVSGMTGDAVADRALIIKHIANETSMSQRAVIRWASNNNVSLHHAGGESVQIVPNNTHALHHSGGAQQIRDGM